MKAEEIRELTDDQILERLEELREEKFRLRFQGAMMQLENPALPKQIRRDIARMKTVLRERELARDRGEVLEYDPGMKLEAELE